MLCPSCHVHTHKGFPFCLKCGLPLKGASIESATPAVLYRPDSDVGISLTKLCTTIGRAPDNDVVVTDRYVSRYHARLWREPSGYRLEDLDSLNGVFLNSAQVQAGASVRLKDYDILGIGPTQVVRIEQPRSVDMGGKTMISAPEEEHGYRARRGRAAGHHAGAAEPPGARHETPPAQRLGP